jgi:hypothetical protein
MKNDVEKKRIYWSSVSEPTEATPVRLTGDEAGDTWETDDGPPAASEAF